MRFFFGKKEKPSPNISLHTQVKCMEVMLTIVLIIAVATFITISTLASAK